MNGSHKRIKKFLNRDSDISFNEVRFVLANCGYELVKVKGSHWRYNNREERERITIPVHNNRVKKCYVKNLIEKIKIMRKNEKI